MIFFSWRVAHFKRSEFVLLILGRPKVVVHPDTSMGLKSMSDIRLKFWPPNNKGTWIIALNDFLSFKTTIIDFHAWERLAGVSCPRRREGERWQTMEEK